MTTLRCFIRRLSWLTLLCYLRRPLLQTLEHIVEQVEVLLVILHETLDMSSLNQSMSLLFALRILCRRIRFVGQYRLQGLQRFAEMY